MTKVLNLDALKTEAPVAIIVNEKRHEMRLATVQTFIDNMRMIEDLGTNPSMIREIEVAKKVILSAFPTLTEKELGDLPLDALRQISDLARGAGGEIVTNDAEAAASGNAQPAS